MKLLQKLFGFSGKNTITQQPQIVPKEQDTGGTISDEKDDTGMVYTNSTSITLVDGKVVSAKQSESLEIWGD